MLNFQIDRQSQPSKDELLAGFKILTAVAEAIREAGEIPSGTLYGALCGRVTLQGWESIVRTLTNAGLVAETSGNLLRWVGPKIEKGEPC